MANTKTKPTARKPLPKRARAALIEDPEVYEVLVEAYRKGLPSHLCAALAGLSVTTLTKWLEQGDRDLAEGAKTPHAELVRETRRAAAEHAAIAMARVNSAGRRNWRAAAWSLERVHGFASKSKVELSGTSNDTAIRVDVDLKGLSVEKLRALAYGEDDDLDKD